MVVWHLLFLQCNKTYFIHSFHTSNYNTFHIMTNYREVYWYTYQCLFHWQDSTKSRLLNKWSLNQRLSFFHILKVHSKTFHDKLKTPCNIALYHTIAARVTIPKGNGTMFYLHGNSIWTKLDKTKSICSLEGNGNNKARIAL